MGDRESKLASELIERKTISRNWLSDNFYPEMESVVQAYRCERDPVLDPDGKPDLEATSIATPLTTSNVNRTVARLTAQPPNVRIRTKDPAISELLSRHMMYAWDQGRIQRQQKRHVRQAALLGYSLRAWYWEVEEYVRHKFVDPLDPDPQVQKLALEMIDATYQTELVAMMEDPQRLQDEITTLLQERGRGAGLIKVQYDYQGYAGPKCDFILFADFYPTPHFESLQKAESVILERRRDKNYFEKLAKAYPELQDGINILYRDYPGGSAPLYQSEAQGGTSSRNFRSYLAKAYAKGQFYGEESTSQKTGKWSISEEHIPGRRPKLRLVGEDNVWIGEIDYPYDLEGKIALTDCVLCDDLLGGIGDSAPRFGRGLQKLQDRAVNTRTDLLDSLVRPLVGTTSRELYDDPSQMKRYKHFRLVRMKSPGDMWVQPEQAAIAAAQASLAGDQTGYQLWQMLTGENNLSMSANVDPAQNRTATGARIAAYIGDVITKDLIDMFTMSSLQPDAEMMYLLCRSEMTKPVRFRANEYGRSAAGNDLISPMLEEKSWAQIEPALFQRDDYEIQVEAGSTLADDDEAKVTKAKEMYTVATARPDLWNPAKARDDLIRVYGKGNEAEEWQAQPQPPPQPPPPVRPSMTLSVKWEDLAIMNQPNEIQQAFLDAAGIHLGGPPPQPGGAPLPGGPMSPNPQLGPPHPAGPPPSGPAPIPPVTPPPPPPAGAGSYMAARGRSPLPPHGGAPPPLNGSPHPPV